MFCACCVLDFASRAVSLTLPRTSEPPPGIPYRNSPVTYWAVLLVVGTCALSDAVLSPAVLRVTRPRSEGPWSGVAGSQGPSQAFDGILPSLPPEWVCKSVRRVYKGFSVHVLHGLQRKTWMSAGRLCSVLRVL